MAAFWGVWASTWPLEVGDAAKLACTNSLLCNLYRETVRERKEEDRRLDLEALLDDEEKAHDQELMLEDWRRRKGDLVVKGAGGMIEEELLLALVS